MQPMIKTSGNERIDSLVSNNDFIRFQYTDKVGSEADTVSIELTADPSGIPKDQFTVQIGFLGGDMRDVGLWRPERVEVSGPPLLTRVEARAVEFAKSLRSAKSRSWHETSLSEIVKKIASEHGYKGATDKELASIEIAHEDQIGESDVAFLFRVAKSLGGRLKVADGGLTVIRAASGTNADGKEQETHEIHPKDATSYKFRADAGLRYGSVKAEWHDVRAGYRRSVTAGGKLPLLVIQNTYPDEIRATAAAKGRLRAILSRFATLSLTMPGNPKIGATHRIQLEPGFPDYIRRLWVVNTATHEITGSGGYKTTLDCDIYPGD